MILPAKEDALEFVRNKLPAEGAMVFIESLDFVLKKLPAEEAMVFIETLESVRYRLSAEEETESIGAHEFAQR